MSESCSDYQHLIDLINRVADADGPDEITEILMETVALTGIEGRAEMCAATILLSQFCAAQALLHNFRQVIVNIPKKGSVDSSESWEGTADLASVFLKAMKDDLWSLRGPAKPEEVSWAIAQRIADKLMEEIARNCLDLAEELPAKGAVN